MSDTLRYTSIQDARAHGAVCGCCHITEAERKLSTCAGCKIVQYDSTVHEAPFRQLKYSKHRFFIVTSKQPLELAESGSFVL